MAVGLLAGWLGHGISGNGILKSESRAAAGFTCVANETPFSVNVNRGDGFAVTLDVDSNLLPFVETEVEDGCLRVSIQEGVNVAAVHGAIDVVLPALTGAAVEGSGAMNVRGFPSLASLDLAVRGSGMLRFAGDVSACSTSVSGSGRMALSGRAERLKAAVEGSGALEAGDFPAKDLEVTVRGSGTASVSANGDSAIDIAGSGIVRAKLTGGTARARVRGSGQVQWTGLARMDSAVSGSGRIVHD